MLCWKFVNHTCSSTTFSKLEIVIVIMATEKKTSYEGSVFVGERRLRKKQNKAEYPGSDSLGNNWGCPHDVRPANPLFEKK